MKNFGYLLFFILLFTNCQPNSDSSKDLTQETLCNPMDLSYRFMPEEPSRREAADPSVLFYKDKYFLFASKSGGYWVSDNLSEWEFIQTNEIPTEEYAPTAISINDTVYFLASSNSLSTIYKSADPLSGHWEVAKDTLFQPVWDPAFYLEDGRLYLYWGCSNQNPIYGIELDYKDNFSPIGEPVALLKSDTEKYGWEVPGDYNRITENDPWIEGAWVNKINGKFYLQYAGPGTEFKSYSDGIYTSDNPLGPYEIASHNPMAYKPEGFAAGAGHGSTFTDKYGNYWHIGTATIAVKHMFERRLSLFSTFVDGDGILYSTTKYGDYPYIMPDKKIESFDEIFPGWMLLSYNKKVTVSSAIDSLPAGNMTDEDIRSYWAAESGNSSEWAAIDLGAEYDIHAVQVNLAEHNTEIYGRQEGLIFQYQVEISEDNNNWQMIIDKSNNQDDKTHDYTQLEQAVKGRYVRIKNIAVPDGNFALSGFRIFGKGEGAKPEKISTLITERKSEDRRVVDLSWDKIDNATGYNISYGIAKDKLYHNYIVYANSSISINTLNTEQAYFFTIEAFNENGITKSELIKKVE